MENIIRIEDLTFKYGDVFIFEHFYLNIKRSMFTTVLGPNGSGKTTLLKILLGLVDVDSNITINNYKLNKENIKKIRQEMGVVFDNPDACFVAETVIDDIAFSLENLNFSKDEILIKVNEISSKLGIGHLLDKRPEELSGGEKQLVAFACALVHNPSIIILDEAFSMIDLHNKEIILKILKEMNQFRKTTIINVTHDTEESLYGDSIVVIDEGKLILKGPLKQVLMEEKIFNELGIELPFMASLSIKLQFYGLIDEMILDMDDMVNVLWK